MSPNRKKSSKTESKVENARTIQKVNHTKKSYVDAKDESLSSENESCNGSKASNTIGNSQVSGSQNSEHGITKEKHYVKKDFLNANLVIDANSPTQSKKNNNFQRSILQQNRSSNSDTDSDAESRKEILRSAEKRIIRKVSTSESDCRNKRVCDKNESSSESDSAPEDVTFETGRKIVLEVTKQRVDSIQQAKLMRKEQRKKKLENYRKQKEEKLLRLKQQGKNINHESASSSAESTEKSHKTPKPGTLKSTSSTTVSKKIYFSSDSDTAVKKSSRPHNLKNTTKRNRNLKRLPADILDSLQDPVVLKKNKQIESTENCIAIQARKGQSKVKNSDLQWDIDYIPLDSSTVTQFGVVPLDKPRKKTVGEEAAAFRENLLYGDKVKRAPATLNSARQQKLKVCGMDRLVTRPV